MSFLTDVAIADCAAHAAPAQLGGTADLLQMPATGLTLAEAPASPVADMGLPQVQRVQAGDAQRAQLEQVLARRYAEVFGARLQHFMPTLLAVRGPQLQAVLGIRLAAQGRLFVEDYLDQPAEQLVAAAIGKPVSRDSLVEVGNLAVLPGARGRHVVAAVTRALVDWGHRHVIFAATRELRAVFARLDLDALPLAPALPERLGERARDWGNYYQTQPVVLCGALLPGLRRLQERGW